MTFSAYSMTKSYSKRTVLLVMSIFTLLSCRPKEQPYVSYTDTVEVNGQSLFYAVEGKGKPIVLLHGNGGSHNDLETTMRQLAQAGYLVYGLDSRGQGANAPLTEYHYADMAEDTYQFIRQLRLDKPAVFGWSDGGIVALMTEVMHPATCSLIVTSGANTTCQGALDPDIFAQIFGAPDDERTPLVQMMYVEPNMTTEELQTIQCPALICAGEHDLILEEHTRQIAAAIPHATVRIFEGADHGSHIWHNRLMGDAIIDFLQEQKY